MSYLKLCICICLINKILPAESSCVTHTGLCNYMNRAGPVQMKCFILKEENTLKPLFNPLYTEETLPHYILEESNFNEIYIFLEKNG